MTTGYYDRAGKPLSLLEWAEAIERETRVVARTTLPNGNRVSTIWRGLNHGYGDGPPLIFEIMVFLENTFEELDCERYATEAEARAGHARMVDKWTAAP